jgi:hypothetical protein
VAIGTDQRIGIGDDLAVLLARPHRLRQVLEIDLVADTRTRRHDAKIVECLLAPAQELVALPVTLVFEFDVLGESERRPEAVDHHRVVDDQVDRHQRVDLLWIGAKRRRGIAHRRKIDHGRHAGKVLHQHPCRAIGNLVFGFPCLQPFCDGENVLALDGAPVLEAQQVLQHHLHRMRQARNPR